MDIQEAREAFERRQAKVLNVPYEGLKAHFDENSRLFGARYNTGSINEKEWNLWLEAWQAAKAQVVQEGFVLVPVETLNEALSWANCASNESWSDAQREEIDKHYEVIENAMIEAQQPSSTSGCPDEP